MGTPRPQSSAFATPEGETVDIITLQPSPATVVFVPCVPKGKVGAGGKARLTTKTHTGK